jgi:phosphatidylglycerol:prolipoprotein diacylglycerol transferase
MLVHPDIDPVAFGLPEFSVLGHHVHIQVHWYGLMYLLGFWGCWKLGVIRGAKPWINWSRDRVSDVVFYVVMGVILGGRLGYELFYAYSPTGEWLVARNPLMIFQVWDGGMSFHGGLIGVSIAMILFAYHQKLKIFDVSDFVATLVPFGLLTGRIGNFINGELWGAPTTLPWGMVFPKTDPQQLVRHPSQLYEAGLEGLVLLGIVWWFGSRPRPRMASTGVFLLGYSVFRMLIELVRVPDAQFGYFAFGWLTMGQILSLPMLIAGIAMLVIAYRRNEMPLHA